MDGHDLSPSCLNFDLHFDRPFRFEATAHGDKEDFLEGIAQACGKYHGAQPPPVFENVSSKVKKNLPTASGACHMFSDTPVSCLVESPPPRETTVVCCHTIQQQ